MHIHLELQVYGSSFIMKMGGGRKNKMTVEQSIVRGSLHGGSLQMNGNTDHVNSYIRVNRSSSFGSSYKEAYLLRKLWALGATPVAPRAFKLKLSVFAPQFSGYNQHNSQEFLVFLLDGLHEDLNRVKYKPYIEAKEVEDWPDEQVADEHWQNHLARNDSIIVDVCQGQYHSKLVCPACKKLSITFDPFMYLSLPLPSTTMGSMTLTVMSTDESTLPFLVPVTIPKYGRCKDLVQALSTVCSLRDDEKLLVAEVSLKMMGFQAPYCHVTLV
ncbi:Ubiquitin carboxyl-terminal hydrolase 5 [Camellia lanceoleosa]|nr:Ubiquitin carboxyl-terminal hydrolase 5 [Camellia lanceoleosa]